MKRFTIFSWGYYGWGNWTRQLIKAVDAVEETRGFRPPVFVDVRLRREVRAKGFSGAAFAKALREPDRYLWMNALGNEAIADHSLDHMKIADPKAASDLLKIANTAAKEKRRVIFFCSCRYPKHNRDDVTCHRTAVARLVLNAAQKLGTPVEICEWPGGEPQSIEIEVSPLEFQAVSKNGRTMRPKKGSQLSEMAGLPWGTVACLKSKGESLFRLVGPANYQGGEWSLPVFDWFEDPNSSLQECKQASPELCKHYGFDPRLSR